MRKTTDKNEIVEQEYNDLYKLIKICSEAAMRHGLTREQSDKILKKVRREIKE